MDELAGRAAAVLGTSMLDTLLPVATRRPLGAQELARYRRPYPDPPSRRPLLAWARQIPGAGDAGHFLPEDRPAEVAAALTAWL